MLLQVKFGTLEQVYLKLEILIFSYKFTYVNWRLITLQYCIGFAIHQQESTTHVPHPEPPSLLPPRTIPLGCPSALAPSIRYHASNLD